MSVAILSSNEMDSISCASKPVFLTSSHLHVLLIVH